MDLLILRYFFSKYQCGKEIRIGFAHNLANEFLECILTFLVFILLLPELTFTYLNHLFTQISFQKFVS
mgnify:CR=1 FL=1|jgi:hypothetical protein